MTRLIPAIIIVLAAVVYEFVAIATDLPTWSAILFAISESKFALVLVSWFIGFVMGHALAPFVRRKK